MGLFYLFSSQIACVLCSLCQIQHFPCPIAAKWLILEKLSAVVKNPARRDDHEGHTRNEKLGDGAKISRTNSKCLDLAGENSDSTPPLFIYPI